MRAGIVFFDIRFLLVQVSPMLFSVTFFPVLSVRLSTCPQLIAAASVPVEYAASITEFPFSNKDRFNPIEHRI